MSTTQTHETLKPGLESQVLSAADAAYEAVSQSHEVPLDEVHFTDGMCNPVTDNMIALLAESGVTAERTNRVVWPDRKWGPNGEKIAIMSQAEDQRTLAHAFGKIIEGSGADAKMVFFDATWQQLLPPEERTPEKPKVLFGTPLEIINQARTFGIKNKALLDLWSSHRSTS